MITITSNNGVFINEIPVEDELAALIVKRGRLVKVISETKVVIRPDINTPGIHRLPWSVLRKFY